MKRSFELFYKINKKSDGSGAGLAIAKKILVVHGGHIRIESELGVGYALHCHWQIIGKVVQVYHSPHLYIQ